MCIRDRGWVAARLGPSNFHRMGRGPTRPIKISKDGPRPGPAHHIFKNSRPGPAQAHQIFKSLGPARPGPSHFQKSLPGPARPRQTAHDKPCIFRTSKSTLLYDLLVTGIMHRVWHQAKTEHVIPGTVLRYLILHSIPGT